MNLKVASKVLVFFAITSQLLFVTAQNVVIANFISLLLLIPFALGWLILKKRVVIDRYTLYLAIFYLYIVLIELFSYNSTISVRISTYVLILIFLIVLINLCRWYECVYLIPWSFIAVSAVNLLLYIGLFNFSFWGDIYGGSRFQGSFENPNGTAVTTLISIFFLVAALRRPIPQYKFLVLSILVIGFSILILATGSKKSIILLPLMYLLFIFNNCNLRRANHLVGIVGLLCLCALVLGLFQDNLSSILSLTYIRFEKLLSNLGDSGDLGGSSTAQRIYLINQGLSMFWEQPFTGHGDRAFYQYFGFVSHNNYVEILFNFGIVGFLLYFSRYILVLVRLYGLVKGRLITALSLMFILLYLEFSLIAFDSKLFLYAFMFLTVYVDDRRLSKYFDPRSMSRKVSA